MTVHLTRMISALLSLSIVTSTDGMTAEFYPFDMAFLGAAATRIIDAVQGRQPRELR